MFLHIRIWLCPCWNSSYGGSGYPRRDDTQVSGVTLRRSLLSDVRIDCGHVAMGRGDVVDSQVSEWLTIAEACEYLKVSRRTAYRWMENGEVPYFMIAAGSGVRRIRRGDLENLMEEMN